MELLQVTTTDTAQKRTDTNKSTSPKAIIIDGDKIKKWRRFWQILALTLAIIFVIVIIILLATYTPSDSADTAMISTDTPTPSPLSFETLAPTMHYLDKISFPLSDHFRIQSYNTPNTSSPLSIITKPRAIRSAFYNGSTLLYIGSSDFAKKAAYVMIDYDSDGINDAEFIIFESSSYVPASLAISNEGNYDLYIALTDQIIKCDGNIHEKVLQFSDSTDRLTECNTILTIPLTAEDMSKSWSLRRYIGISPSNELCVSNGMTCDDCTDDSVDLSFPHGTITCFNDLDVSAMVNTNMSDANDANILIKADGVRNSVGFDWNGVNNAFYFTDNGRDEVHSNYPDDELNYVGNNTHHFGFPNCHTLGSGIGRDRDVSCVESYIDPGIANPGAIDCSVYQNSLQALGPHVVPLGMRFYNGNMFPNEFTNCIFIAERGSGDSDSFGYRIVVVQLNDNGTRVLNHKIFADGFYDYEMEIIHGKPVDLDVFADGSMVIADDTAQQIYRITYEGSDRNEMIFDGDMDGVICNFSYVN